MTKMKNSVENTNVLKSLPKTKNPKTNGGHNPRNPQFKPRQARLCRGPNRARTRCRMGLLTLRPFSRQGKAITRKRVGPKNYSNNKNKSTRIREYTVRA
uniref:Uncharacterized protein n=1 Tax=Anguilla anguilla TaxID=7936 RepID=A0A0E9WNN3_ANGAN